MIRDAIPADSQAIANIYNYYVLNTVVTFEELAVTNEVMQQRVADIQKNHSWLVHEEHGTITGYAYAGPWKPRAAYRHSVEISVYLDPAHTGRGLGRQLYAALIKKLEGMKIHAVIGGVALPNHASVRLHESLGFKKVAHFKETGFKFGKWVDVAYWELLPEH